MKKKESQQYWVATCETSHILVAIVVFTALKQELKKKVLSFNLL